jgi:predicted AlkP superfamily phosphohydrolase/phosphomutase
MIPDGEYTAVVDRIEETLATLEVSDGDERYNLVIGEEELPEDGRHADAILHVSVVDDELADVEYQPEETARRQDDAQSRFDRLSKRPPGRDEDDGPADPP